MKNPPTAKAGTANAWNASIASPLYEIDMDKKNFPKQNRKFRKKTVDFHTFFPLHHKYSFIIA